MPICKGAAPGRRPRRLGSMGVVASAVALWAVPSATPAAIFSGMGRTGDADLTIAALSDTGVAYALAGREDAPNPSVTGYRSAYVWSAASPSFAGYIQASGFGGIVAVAADGSAAGWAFNANGGYQAAASGRLGASVVGPPSDMSIATAISANGGRVAGFDDAANKAFITGSAAGLPAYPFLSFTPSALSADGRSVVGSSSYLNMVNLDGYVSPAPGAGTAWKPVTGLFPGLPDTSAGPGSVAVASSNPIFRDVDQDVALTIAGNGSDRNMAQAFVFHKALGEVVGPASITFLGALAGDLASSANGMSADGSLVIGASLGAGGASRPFLWTAAKGLQNLATVLASTDPGNLAGWQLQSATALSANGRYVAGVGLHNGQPETWIANLVDTHRRLVSAAGPQVDFGSTDSWLDASGIALTGPPGALDDLLIRPLHQADKVAVLLGPDAQARSVEFAHGDVQINGGKLIVGETWSVHDINLRVGGPAVIVANKLVVGAAAAGLPGLLEIGSDLRDDRTRIQLQSADILPGGWIVQRNHTSVTVADRLTVRGRVDTSVFADMEVGRLEVLANCNARKECSTPGTFEQHGRLRAGSIYNSGDFIWHGVVLDVGSGTPSTDRLDAFLNEGTLSVYTGDNPGSFGVMAWRGNLTNAKGGTVKTYGVAQGVHPATIDWGSGTFTNLGAYTSDPAVNVFGTLVVAGDGYLAGGADDVFQVRGDFTSTSTSTQWDVAKSTLSFLGTGLHTYRASGSAAWGTLALDAGATLALKASGSGEVHLSFASLAGFSSLADLQARFSADSGITIDVASIGGGWAGTGTITLPGGGTLISAVPEPAAAWTMLAGLLGLGLARRRATCPGAMPSPQVGGRLSRERGTRRA